MEVMTEEPERAKPIILLIDDDEAGMNARQQLLEMQGYFVLVASTAESGLQVFSSTDVDLLIIDYQLPGISGMDLLTRLRNINLRVPIILLSGRIFLPENAIVQADGFFRKGEGPRKLLETVKRLLTMQDS